MTRRLRAKPEAIAERARMGRGLGALLEDGAAAIAQTGRADPDPPRGDLARLEVRTAERDRALDLLAELERIITMTGGYMAPRDQDALRAARALLVELGRREPEVTPVWRDRG